jgi:DNA-binding transcriptional regulator GbsR (MarR family)
VSTAAESAPDPLRTFVERMSLALHERGWSRMPARVYVALLCDEREQLTARQLTGLLGVSAAAISSAVNQLIESGLVVRDPIPGSRQEHYRLAPGGILGAVMRKQEASPHLAELAENGVSVLGSDSPGGERLSELAEFVRFMDNELQGISERWKERRAARDT